MNTRRLYIAAVENHLDLRDEQKAVMDLGTVLLNDPPRSAMQLSGNEELAEQLKSGALNLGSGLFQVSKWVGGTTISLFSKALGAAGNGLVRAFGDNDTLIKKLLQKVAGADEHELDLSQEKVAALTAEGDIADLSRDMDTLIRTLGILDTHSRDLLSFLDKQLLIARKLKNASTTDAIMSITEEFENLKYPTFNLQHHNGDKWASDVLPGGRTWEFVYNNGTSPKYLMSGDTPSGAGTSATFSKSEVSSLLSKLDKVNGMHKRLKQSYDNYLSFIKSWSDMVKAVDANLSKLDKVSKTAHGEAEKLLAGEPNALAFYSGFTPRVVSYSDKYIHGVLGVFA